MNKGERKDCVFSVCVCAREGGRENERLKRNETIKNNACRDDNCILYST